MKTRILIFISLVISTGLFAQPTGYLWPTDASPYLSSTFAETRSAHFHAGLDIKTWGREGFKVFASKSGRIVRMAITSQGYGRVLYMKHNDETYTVYAHLQRFNPELQSYIDSVRLINHQFEIDLDVGSENWYFEQGDVIGYTGSTGIGPPHLHFEIRDKNKKPINALLTNLNIKDTIAPSVSAVLVIPMSDTTLIEGSKFPRVYYPTNNSDNEFDLGLIKANGPIGIAINEFDQAEDVTNKYASYEFRIKTNSTTLFYSKHDSFGFDEAETMFIDRIQAYGAYRRSYQTLFQEESLKVPFYKSTKNNGVLTPKKNQTSYAIIVNDIYGNSTKIDFDLQEASFVHDVDVKPNPDVYQWYWRNDWLTQHSLYSIDLRYSNVGFNWNSKHSQRLAFLSGKEMLFTRLDPESSYTIISPDRNLKVHFTESSFFDSTSIAIYSSERNGFPSINVMPYTTPVRNDFYIEYYLSDKIEANQNYQLFHFDPFRDKYTHIPGRLIGRTMHASPDVLGEFVIFPDNEAPIINNVDIIVSDYGANYVEISILEELSGVDFEQSEIQVNGVRGITEYDFEEDKLIYIHPEFVPESRNRIEVIVTDNAGNSRFEVFYR